MTDIVIVAAARTAVGNFNGSLASLPAQKLGQDGDRGRAGARQARAGRRLRGHPRPDPGAGGGQNPARQASVNAGIPNEVPAYARQHAVRLGPQVGGHGLPSRSAWATASIVIAGGQESMSQAPHVAHLRNGTKMGSVEFMDTMLRDGLLDSFQGYHMGQTAENVAEKWQITREEQDKFARRLAEQGRGGDQGRQVQGRDRAGHDQEPQGRHRLRHRRVPAARRHLRAAGQAAPGLQQGRLGHGRQRVRHQ